MKLQKWFLQMGLILSIVLLASMNISAHNESRSDKDQTASELMTPELLWKLGRLGDAAVSADGSQVAYSVRRYDLAEDKGASSLYLLNRRSGESQPLIENWSSLGSLQWSQVAGDERIFFEGAPAAKSDDEETPSTQAWSIDSRSGEKKQLTDLKDGIANLKISPTARKLAFTLDVKMAQKPNEIYPDLPKADAADYRRFDVSSLECVG